MKKGMHKFLVFLSCSTLCMSFFIVPVSAESDVYYPPEYSYSCYQYFINNGYSTLSLTTSEDVTYNVSLDNSGSISGSESGSEHTTGTINSNGSATLGAKYMNCTQSGSSYSCYFSNRANAVSNSQSINIGFNENTYTSVNNTISLTQNTDITGTLKSTTHSYIYNRLPWIKGTYTSGSGYEWSKRLWLDDNTNDVYMIFYTRARIRNLDKTGVSISRESGGDTDWTYQLNDIPLSGLYLNIFHIKYLSGSGNISISYDNLGDKDVLPLFYGTYDQMPDSVATLARLRRSTNELLENGNDNTASSISNAENSNSQVSNKINDFDNIESNSVIDMNTNIQNLDITSDILENSKFLSSANWVKVQFDRMTVNTPIGSVLSFSLILGITLIFLGKIR